jgi:hypothetical protein
MTLFGLKTLLPWANNPKLTPKWQGPAKISEVNNTNARLQLPNGKTKIYNVMRLKKFFAPPDATPEGANTTDSDLNFKDAPKITGPVTRAMKKLLLQKEATEMAINVLCDLSKKHCSMCEWEQEFSDNPLLFDPVFAKRYIAERKSWLINKQSMCARCKLQFGEHLIEQNAQNATNLISAASESLQNLITKQFFDEATSKDLLHIQNLIKEARRASDTSSDSENLISAPNDTENLINAQQSDIF